MPWQETAWSPTCAYHRPARRRFTAMSFRSNTGEGSSMALQDDNACFMARINQGQRAALTLSLLPFLQLSLVSLFLSFKTGAKIK